MYIPSLIVHFYRLQWNSVYQTGGGHNKQFHINSGLASLFVIFSSALFKMLHFIKKNGEKVCRISEVHCVPAL